VGNDRAGIGMGLGNCFKIFRWIQAYATELEKRIRPHLRMSNGSWRVGETYIRAKGRWTYLYRAVDSPGQTIDFLLSARREVPLQRY
jgi:IS6 family transposase